jgi:DNA-binding IclR family transcriptional regulator
VKYNGLKRNVLTHLERKGWQTEPEIALAVGYPIWSLYAYLRRLRYWGLVWERRRSRVEFTISQRGRERLRWLRGLER